MSDRAALRAYLKLKREPGTLRFFRVASADYAVYDLWGEDAEAVAAGDYGSTQLPALKRVNVESCRSMTGSIIPLASCKQLVSLDLSFTDLTGARAILMMGRLCPHLKRVKAVLAPRIMFRLDKSHVAMIKRLEPSQDHSADRFNKPNWAQFATELRRKRPDLDVTTDVTAK